MPRYTLVGLLAPLLVGFAAAPAPKDAAKSDLNKLQGTWKVVRVQRGERVHASGLRAVVEKGQWTYYRGGVSQGPMTLVLDPKAKPPRFEFRRSNGPRAYLLQGIYDLDGDTLRLSYQLGAKASAPTGFGGSAPGQITLTLQRQKP